MTCHPERKGPQTSFSSGDPADRSSSAGWSLGVVSRKPALSEAEGDLRLFLHELQDASSGWESMNPTPTRVLLDSILPSETPHPMFNLPQLESALAGTIYAGNLHFTPVTDS